MSLSSLQVLRGEPFVVAVANTETPFNDQSPALRRDFKVTPIRVVKPAPTFGGAGVAAVSPADMKLLRETSQKRPRRPSDYLQLLAAVNRRAAESGRHGSETVSPGCVASYLSPDGGIETRIFGDDGAEKKIETPPYVWFGIDFTELMRTAPRWDPATGEWLDKAGEVVDPKNWWGGGLPPTEK
jgi:hypothetical protein